MDLDEEELEWYKLNEGSHSFRGMRAKKGGKILLTSKEAGKLGGRVSRMVVTTKTVPVVSSSPSSITTATTTTSRNWSSTQEMRVPEVIALVDETTEVNELESLYDVEEKGLNRTTILKAIEKKVAVLEGG